MVSSIELFSGAGGLAKGLELAGAKPLALVEWNAEACNTLRYNYPHELVHEIDVRDFCFTDYKDVDIVAGGPPCQPFSLGGKAKGDSDERDMFPHAAAVIRQLLPKAFIFENVKGLLREAFADYFQYILLQLTYPDFEFKSEDWRENLSALHSIKNYKGTCYNVKYRLVNAADYGVPQKRERVIIVGFRNDLGIDWDFPEPTHSEDALLWQKYVTREYWQRHSLNKMDIDEHAAMAKQQALKTKYGLWAPDKLPWITVRDALVSLPETNDVCTKSEAREYPGHTGSLIDEPSKTLKAGAHGVPGGENMIKFNDGTVRYFTVAEAKRIQTFPDDYRIAGVWSEAMRQMGNAVPVELAKSIASSVIRKINTSCQ